MTWRLLVYMGVCDICFLSFWLCLFIVERLRPANSSELLMFQLTRNKHWIFCTPSRRNRWDAGCFLYTKITAGFTSWCCFHFCSDGVNAFELEFCSPNLGARAPLSSINHIESLDNAFSTWTGNDQKVSKSLFQATIMSWKRGMKNDYRKYFQS